VNARILGSPLAILLASMCVSHGFAKSLSSIKTSPMALVQLQYFSAGHKSSENLSFPTPELDGCCISRDLEEHMLVAWSEPRYLMSLFLAIYHI
jgi:hypothetical protein